MSNVIPLVRAPGRAPRTRDADLARARGRSEIAFEVDGRGRTRLARLAQRSPARVLRPIDDAGEAGAVLVNTAGGICGGDVFAHRVALGHDARATVSTQAAERVYRALDRRAQVRTTLRLDRSARLHWAPQETIVFDGSRFERRTEIHLAEGARLLAAEMLVFGRRAMGERLGALDLRDDWRVWVAGRLSWADAFEVSGEPPEALSARPGLDGQEALATTLWCGPEPERHCVAARTRLADHAAVRAGVSSLRDVSVARVIGPSSAVRRALVELSMLLRSAVLGFGSALPRVWAT